MKLKRTKSSPSAPVEGKVWAAGTGTGLAGVATWVLTVYVFHGHMPAALAALLPVITGTAGALLSGYQTKHTDRPEALETVLRDILNRYFVPAPARATHQAVPVVQASEPAPWQEPAEPEPTYTAYGGGQPEPDTAVRLNDPYAR